MTTLETARELFGATIRVSTPLVFAALGGLFSERSGVVNIALEGKMLVGALGAAVGTLASHSPWIGLACGAGAGMALAALYAVTVIQLRANQIVAGTAINMLAFGVTPFICKLAYDVTGSTPDVPSENRFHAAPFYLCWALVIGCWFWMRKTRGGLWVNFAGENPEALDAAGIRVNRVRWLAVLASGALAGIGGATLSICLASRFSRDMTAGRGFMALAALIFGKWRPVPAALACLLFGFTEALQIRLQLWDQNPVPAQFVQVLPYVVTVLALAGFVGHSRAPKALGTTFSRD